jgi:hypothetical protein
MIALSLEDLDRMTGFRGSTGLRYMPQVRPNPVDPADPAILSKTQQSRLIVVAEAQVH